MTASTAGWRDANMNGRSDSREVVRFGALGVLAISLDYNEQVEGRDRHGKRLRYRSTVLYRNDAGQVVRHFSYDAELAPR